MGNRPKPGYKKRRSPAMLKHVHAMRMKARQAELIKFARKEKPNGADAN